MPHQGNIEIQNLLKLFKSDVQVGQCDSHLEMCCIEAHLVWRQGVNMEIQNCKKIFHSDIQDDGYGSHLEIR